MRHQCLLSATIIFVVLITFHQPTAARILREEHHKWIITRSLVSGSLQRGPVIASGASSCSYITRINGPRCPIHGVMP
ncbi:hypothetical protein ACHQM5_014412 [Ranunculus cassubicifolius]